MFQVKPIQGIIAPGRTQVIDINIILAGLENFMDIFKNKFMI